MRRPEPLRVALMSPHPSREVAQPPLALGSLVAYALCRPKLKEKVRFSILEAWAGRPARELAETVLAERPGVVGFSCYVWNVEGVLAACALIKAARPETLIVLGGPEASPRAQALLAESAADAVAQGEGEETFAELLEAVREGRGLSGIAGLVWRDGGKIRVEAPRPLIEDLSVLPSPYLTGVLKGAPGADLPVEVSRGCPFTCKYCTWNSTTMRYFPVERVLSELDLLAGQARRMAVQLVTTDLFLEPRRAERLLRGLEAVLDRRDPGWVIGTWAYLGHWKTPPAPLRVKDLVLMSGVQSVNPAALKSARRFLSQERVAAAVRWCAEQSPPVQVQLELIQGLPGDTLDGFRASLDWTLSLKHYSIHTQPLAVFPDSELRGLAGIRFDPKPSYSIRALPGFPSADMRRANLLAYTVALLRSDTALRSALERLGDGLRGRGPLPYLRPYEDLADALQGGPLDLLRRYRKSRAHRLLSFIDWPVRVGSDKTFAETSDGSARADLGDPLRTSHREQHALLDLKPGEHREAMRALRAMLARAPYLAARAAA